MVPLVRLLCIAHLSLFAACLTYPVLVAAGSVRDTLLSSLISLPPSLLIIFVASFFGVEAVAASALLTLPFQAAVAIYFVRPASRPAADRSHSRAAKERHSRSLQRRNGRRSAQSLVERGTDRTCGRYSGRLRGCRSVWLAALFAVQHPLLPELKAPLARVFYAASRLVGHVPVPAARTDRDVC